MENIAILLLWASIFVWACIHVLTSFTRLRKSKLGKLPPGPFPLPIIGSLFKLGNKPHESLADLAKTYGPLMTLKLGYVTTVVVSSAKMAKEVLNKNDKDFADRTIPDAAYVLNHYQESIAWLPANDDWRNLRKLCNSQMFTTQRLDASQDLRRQKVLDLLAHISECSHTGQAINIGRITFTITLNLISNTLFSVDLAHLNSESSQEFKNLVWGVLQEGGRPNLVDFFPILSRLDPQGVRRRTEIYVGKLFELFDSLIDQRLKSHSPTIQDFLNILLDGEQVLELSKRSSIKHLLLDLLIAGSDTTASTIEWAMAELLREPIMMAKARLELKETVGKDKQVEESDIARLPYLRAIVKETLRLHPPGPLLLPHKAINDVEICGFTVPKHSQVLVNAWTIGRDPNTWVNPNSFLPERFVGSDINYKGQDFELIPFSAGRRMCPGLPMAGRMLHLVLASLLHSIDWRLQDGMKPQDIDMGDNFGLTLQKAKPLLAIPVQV